MARRAAVSTGRATPAPPDRSRLRAADRPPAAATIAAAEPVSLVPPPGQTFNLLEIGEMVENEDMDGIDFSPMGYTPSVAIPPPPVPPRPPAAAASLDDTGMSWLDEAEKNGTRRRRARTAAADSRSVFDEEDDFFDLAAELEQELSQEDLFPGGAGVGAAPAEQSLEEIVEGFKKGVAEHLSPTDYDTHFNLGIAYREMGLLDEAIGEFQIAAKDDGHLVLCCSMLGLCFLDKGLPDVAITWYERGLEAPGLSDEDHLGLLYDLGCSYLALEDRISAFQTFVDLSGLNPNYRDVAARIEQLGN